MSLDQPSEFVKHQTLTRDAFLDGRLTVSQPRNGFRAGLDSVLLGAATNRACTTLLDLGAGVGTASLVSLAHNAALNATLVDHNQDMMLLAKDNIAVNDFANRAITMVLDVAAKGAVRAAAGLKTDYYASVIANPPFFVETEGTLALDPGRAGSRHMRADLLDLWVKTAAASAAPGGEIIFIYPLDSLGALLAAFEQRFGGVIILPMSPRPGEPVTRVMIKGIKGSRAPTNMLAGRALHGPTGRGFAAEFDAIFRGRARLVW
ncbi:methyltransferase [Devosia rhodophyticola]|uniref:Methyltransferase n=1 Tax=Devosia rhodophyticola TaxID=3026423 RepID=A0ABY7YYS5_9HYPH|nr:methyltransferase [Devosia rhodophyticola]WDR06516.1 methyltransferase [Devosia rhodophyticola]